MLSKHVVVTCGHAASCMFGASMGLETEKTVALCKCPKYSTFKTEDISMVLFHQRPVLPGGHRFRQFCFDANNYIISWQKYIAFQYSIDYYQECSMSMSIVMIIFRSVLEISWNQNIFLLADMNWENRNSGNVGKGLDAVNKGKI
jgi:hypothetical protein